MQARSRLWQSPWRQSAVGRAPPRGPPAPAAARSGWRPLASGCRCRAAAPPAGPPPAPPLPVDMHDNFTHILTGTQAWVHNSWQYNSLDVIFACRLLAAVGNMLHPKRPHARLLCSIFMTWNDQPERRRPARKAYSTWAARALGACHIRSSRKFAARLHMHCSGYRAWDVTACSKACSACAARARASVMSFACDIVCTKASTHSSDVFGCCCCCCAEAVATAAAAVAAAALADAASAAAFWALSSALEPVNGQRQ